MVAGAGGTGRSPGESETAERLTPEVCLLA